MKSFVILITLIILFVLPVSTHAETTQGGVIEVNITWDRNDPFGCEFVTTCSLREAVALANSDPDLSTIGLEQNTTYDLTFGQLVVTEDVIIKRDGAGVPPTIESNGTDRHLEFRPVSGSTLQATLDTLRLTGGKAEKGGSILNAGELTLDNVSVGDSIAEKANLFADGGGIYNESTGHLTIKGGSQFYSNRANFGGAIYNLGGIVIVRDSNIYDNEATGHPQSNGGAIRNAGNGARLEIYNSVIDRNEATEWGGGIRNVSPAELYTEDTRFDDNQALLGGGLWNNSVAEIRRSYFTDNRSFHDGSIGLGSAIYTKRASDGSGRLDVINSTLFLNRLSHATIANDNGLAYLTLSSIFANEGAGVYSFGSTHFNNVFIGNSTVTDCDIVGNSASYMGVSADTDGTCAGNFSEITTPDVVGATNYGKEALVLEIASNSDLIDATNGPSCFNRDQRGAGRPLDGDGDGTAWCDIGAYEYSSVPLSVGVGVAAVSAEFPSPLILLILLTGLTPLVRRSRK